MLKSLQEIDNASAGSTGTFLSLFGELKNYVINNPNIMYK